MNISTLLIFKNLLLPQYAIKITECAAAIMSRYSEVQSSIVYQNVGKLADNILGNEMANTTRIINIEKYTTYTKNELEPYYMLTIILKSISELEKYFNSVYRILGWNSRAKHFIIYIGDEDVQRIIELSWEKFIIRLLIMDKDQNLYTYYPLENNTCGNKLRKHLLFNCESLDFNVLDGIYARWFTDFQGCPVKVLTFPISPYVIDVNDTINPGFEIKALVELSQRLNFTIEYVAHNNSYWGVKTHSDGYTEMYEDFYKRKANIMLGMLVANGTFLYDFDATIAHAKSDLAFYVPAAQRAHPWENAILVYTKRIWIIIFIIVIGMAVTWCIVGHIKEKNENYNSFQKCFFVVFGIILGESMPQPQSHTFRYIFVIWTFYSLVLTSTFESALMSFLTKPNFEKEINTIADLAASPLKIGGVAYAKELFGNSNDPHSKLIYKKWIDCDLDAFCVNRTADKRDMAAMNDVRQVNYLSKERYIKSDSSRKLHQMPISSSSYMWILMLKGFPLRQSFDRMIQRFIESGLMEKWTKEVSHSVEIVNSVKHIALSVDHILLSIIFLGGGYCLALIAFIAENVYFKMNKTHTE